ncbi:endonuclease MutS2 [Clostridiaceae bacterium NSJ-31]|uniref:Endonuclease MutS2 n=2 Tax=Ligaoa zhengdingensis TaxID=2763658 RepID=A0A926DVN5_9FIRM|nr:endonuclease MutS2 [Ligaoa zhengdingensis]MBC8545566.1 endonuclease MutS2 [Ligaoa zhengdingensis]
MEQNDQKHYRALELDKILARLADCCSCEESRARALEIEPQTDYPRAVRQMHYTQDAHLLALRFGMPTVLHIKNVKGMLKRAQVGALLNLRELMDISNVLRTIRNLSSYRKNCDDMETALDAMFESLTPHRDLEDIINNNILSEEELADTASPELQRIRRSIRNTELKVRSQLDKLVKSPTYQKYLQDSIITMRDGRFVVPVKQEYRNEIKGMVHDTSSSGATLFVEPIAVVEANNEIRVLQNKEQQEIERIIAGMSAEVGARADVICADYDTVVELDLYFAKARLGRAMKATVPTITDDAVIDLRRARHPMIDQGRVVPTDIRLGGAFDTLVITGPNTGGKTVSLKTLGLFTLMAMCGLMLPVADSSTVSVFDHVLADIGDEQSIEQSLSTFSAHMTNIVSILQRTDHRTLVLLDELGAGTDPIEGAALAIAILSALREKGAKIAATTHYAELKVFALETDGVENASCEFDVESLSPTYRLSIGVPGRSNAFAISERLGLDAYIIEQAKQHVSNENTRFEDVVSQLEDTRLGLEKEKDAAQQIREQAERMKSEIADYKAKLEKEKEREIERAKNEAKRLIDKVRVESQRLVDELEEIKKQKDSEHYANMPAMAKAQMKAGINKLYELADPVRQERENDYVLPRKLVRGDIVSIVDLGKDGTVLSPVDNAGNVMIQVGIMKIKVAQSRLRLDERKNKVTLGGKKGSVGKNITSRAERTGKNELDLRGMTAEEALIELDRFIDGAVLAGLGTITIIHGKGTGALRAAVHRDLKQNKSIKTFRLGVYGEGEDGVTIAELK